MTEIHVIVVSSVRPESTSAGQILLYRHLVNHPDISLEVYGEEPKRRSLSTLIRRIAGRLERSFLRRFVADFWVLWAARWLDPELPHTITNPTHTVVVTVAHGDGFLAARRFGRRHGLPLLVFFHDWWPDMLPTHECIGRILERQFRDIYHDSDAALCVSQGMLSALGDHSGANLVFPIPAARELAPLTASMDEGEATCFRLLYFGNLTDYGQMLGDLLDESLDHPEILLQVRGSNPDWSESRKDRMRIRKRWLDFAPRADLDSWLESADAFLIPMVFDLESRRRMETNFPSKLVEFAQFEKPLVIWGPAYCSAVQWAQAGEKALCITKSDPREVISSLNELRSNRDHRSYYAEQTKHAAQGEFNPSAIQARFRNILDGLIDNYVAE